MVYIAAKEISIWVSNSPIETLNVIPLSLKKLYMLLTILRIPVYSFDFIFHLFIPDMVNGFPFPQMSHTLPCLFPCCSLCQEFLPPPPLPFQLLWNLHVLCLVVSFSRNTSLVCVSDSLTCFCSHLSPFWLCIVIAGLLAILPGCYSALPWKGLFDFCLAKPLEPPLHSTPCGFTSSLYEFA